MLNHDKHGVFCSYVQLIYISQEYKTSNKAVSASLLFQNPSHFDVTFKYSKKYLKIQDLSSIRSEITKNQHVLLHAIKITDPLSSSCYSTAGV